MRWGDGQPDKLVVDGKTFEVASWGPVPTDAPTIIVLHEGLGCVALWRDFPAKLSAATGFGVFGYSRAGYGQSDPAELPRPLDYMTREATETLPKILDAVGFQKGLLLGHSDGATIAAIYAGSVSDVRVRGLVLMAPHFFAEDMGLRAIADAREAFKTDNLAERMAKYHKDPNATFYGWNDAWLHAEFRQWNVSDVIDYVRIPTLAIQGRQDQYGSLAQIDEIVSRSYAPVETAILEACRHSPHFDQPDMTLSAITEFTSRLQRIEQAAPVI